MDKQTPGRVMTTLAQKLFNGRHQEVLAGLPPAEDPSRQGPVIAGAKQLVDAYRSEKTPPTSRTNTRGRWAVNRAVILALADSSLTYGQIGEVIGCPVGTVRSRLSRARAALKAEQQAETPAAV